MAEEISQQFTLHKLLNDRFQEMQRRNPAYSLRAFAKRLVISPSALSEIMRGRRQVSYKMYIRLLDKLECSPAEKEAALKHMAPQGILAFHTPKKFTELAEPAYKIIADWYHFAIMSLAETKGFQGSTDWIAERLNIPESTARDAVERLVNASMLIRRSDGSVEVTGKSFCTTDEISSEAIKKAHSQNLELAKNSLKRDELSRRDFRAATLAISPEKIKDAKKLISEFIDRLMVFLEDGKKEEVYKVCVQLFPLSVPTGEKMTSLMKALIVLGAVLLPLRGLAGHKENNGGGVIYCPVGGANVQVKLLDIWEAERLKGLGFDYLRVDVASNMAKIRGSNPELYEKLFTMSQVVANPEKIVDLPSDLQIEPPFDARNGFMQVGCSLKGMGMYDDAAGLLYLDRALFNRLPYLDAKAFLIHEAAYKVFRHWYSADTSIGARRFVGCLFSSSNCPELDPNYERPVIDSRTWQCHSTELAAERDMPNFEFLVTTKPGGGSRLHLLSAWGHPPSARSVLEFNSLSLSLGSTAVEGQNGSVRLFSSARLGKTLSTFSAVAGQDIDAVFASQSLAREVDSASTGWWVTVDGSPIVCNRE